MCQDEVKSVATSYKWIHNQITKGLSSIGEVETWLEGLKTYKSVTNTL